MHALEMPPPLVVFLKRVYNLCWYGNDEIQQTSKDILT